MAKPKLDVVENTAALPALTPKELGRALDNAVGVLHRIQQLAECSLDDTEDAALYACAIIDIAQLHGKALDDLLPRTEQKIATGYFDDDPPADEIDDD